MTSLKPHKRARLGIARTFQRLEIFGSLSVRENVLAAAEIRRRWSHDRSNAAGQRQRSAGPGRPVAAWRTVPPTHCRRGKPASSSSPARSPPDPRLLLLDEPSSGLSDSESEELGDLLCQLAGAGMGVLLVEHDMGLVMGVCSQINVLDFGAVLMVGSPDEVRADERVRAAYLGSAEDPAEDLDAVDAGGTTITSSHRFSGADAMAEPPVLELRRVHAAYGQIEVLHGIDLAVALGRGARTPRPQRRGQVDDAQGGERPDGAHQGLFPRARASRQRHCARRAGAGRPLHPSRRPRHLPQPHRHREPAADDLCRGVAFARREARLHPLPPPGRAPPPGGRDALGRRATDAGHGAHAERGARRPAARRDLDGPRADDRRRALRAGGARSPPRALP